MKRIFLSVLGMLIFNNAHSQEFDFNGAVLGMKLDDFKTLLQIGTKLTPDGKTVWCTPKLDKLECHRMGDDPFGQTFGFTIPNYLFDKDQQGEYRLYMIMIMTDRRNLPLADVGLSTKWGKGNLESTTATNGLGQDIKKTNTVWKKPNSELRLESPCGSTKYLCITYTHKPLYQESIAKEKPSDSGF